MKHKQSVVLAVIFLVAGLLMVIIVLLIHRPLKFPDFLTGTLMGFGIGIEIVASIKLAKLSRLKKTRLPC